MTQPSVVEEETASTSPYEREPLLGFRDRRGDEAIASNHGPIESRSIEPVYFKDEAAILLRYASPLILTYALQYGQQVLVVAVASQLSTDELAGVSLGITTQNILGYAVFEGMSTSLDTLCPQAYGALRFTDVGLHMIRFMIFVHLVAIPIAALWLSSEQLLLLVHVPSKALAIYAGNYLRYAVLGIPGYAMFEAGKRFMQAQGNFTAALYVLLLNFPIQIVLTWLFVGHAQMGVAGTALAVALTNTTRPFLLVAYTLCVNRKTLKCWPTQEEIAVGWKQDWGVMVKLSFAGAIMSISEWLCFEILTFVTSYVGTAALAAQTFLSVIATIAWHFPFSASVACSTRIAQLVGAGRSAVTVTLMKWYSFVFFSIGAFNCGLQIVVTLLALKYLVHDPEVAHIIMITLPYAAIFVIFDATANWPHSIIRGYGWQSVGAWVTTLLNYLMALPLAIYLELGPPQFGIRGLYLGLGVGVTAITVVEALVIWLRLKRRTIVQAVGCEERAVLIDNE